MLCVVFGYPLQHVHIPQTLQSMVVFMLPCTLAGPKYGSL